MVVVIAVDSLAGPCNIGKKGFAAYGKKIEGDGKTPTGIYSITHFFSKDPNFSANLEKITVYKTQYGLMTPRILYITSIANKAQLIRGRVKS